MAIKQYILKEKDNLIQWRRYFHAHPEVSLKEFHTCEKIEEELDKMGIPHRRVGETGVYAWIDGKGNEGKERVMVLRSDIDALAMQDLKENDYCSKNDGVCHACGHDAHIATLLGAAKVLKEQEEQFGGQVRLFFQHAEEIGQGARQFIKEGLLEGANRVFGAHVSSQIDSGSVALTAGPQNASCDYFKIKIRGKGAHVSTPHYGIDALYVASQIVVALQSIVSRNTDPLETVVVGIGVLKAGTQYNIVAEHAEIEGTTRCFSNEVRQFTNKRVETIVKQTAELYGATAEIEFRGYANPLINDEGAVEEVTKVAEKIIDKARIIPNFQKMLGADDFADFLEVIKGMYAFVGTRNKEKEHTEIAHHHGLFDIDEDALLLSCNLYVDYALEVLNNEK